MSEPMIPSPSDAVKPLIRPATRADDNDLAELARDTWSPLHAVHPRAEPPYAPFFDDKYPPEEILVAEVDGRIAGFIRLLGPSHLAANAHVRLIQGLAVAGWSRGRGVARALLRAAMDDARRQGAVRITLRVLGHNAPARALYASEGFGVEGVLPGEFFLDGKYVDDVLMGRTLAP
ncbi:GNAT family N-acetyltransferase [Streptomyces sp. 21So2-11]|uniref:GNAT family N-acetyltransferase n=1 Tax=Streptomyces sp. 21So2-11 TaxID=3144408 RepID=UPI0032191EFE